MCIDNPLVFDSLAERYCKLAGAACMVAAFDSNFFVVAHHKMTEFIREDGWVAVLVSLEGGLVVLENNMPMFHERDGEDRSGDCWSRVVGHGKITANDIANALKWAATITE